MYREYDAGYLHSRRRRQQWSRRHARRLALELAGLFAGTVIVGYLTIEAVILPLLER